MIKISESDECLYGCGFHPNIYKYQEIFKQEGWHYELESEDALKTINGVVYNEMKGAFPHRMMS